MRITRLTGDRLAEAVDVLHESFYDYPFVRYILEDAADAYDHRLRLLMEFFTLARIKNDHLVLAAMTDGGDVVGVANVTLPGTHPPNAELARRRKALWAELGPEALARYESYGRACEAFHVEEPHYHVNMIGVRRARAGRGVGGQLLARVHQVSDDDPTASGVSLTTEDPANVPLYEHLGYTNVGTVRITDALTTWGFFRSPGRTIRDPGVSPEEAR